MADVYTSMSIGELLDEWNTSNEGAKSRNMLRAKLGWQKGLSLYTLLVSEIRRESAALEDIPFPDSLLPHPAANNDSGKLGLDFFALNAQLADPQSKVAEIAQVILDAGHQGNWNFEDPRQGPMRFERPGDMNEAFLTDMVDNVYYMDDLTGPQVALLKGIFGSFRRWYRETYTPSTRPPRNLTA